MLKPKRPNRWTKLSDSENVEFEKWKEKLPSNLKNTGKEYDLTGAWKGGMQPNLEDDNSYHLPSRNPNTGEYYKSIKHPTALHGAEEDRKIGYEPMIVRNGLKRSLYTGSEEDPAKPHGKVVSSGDKAINTLSKINKRQSIIKSLRKDI